MATATLPQYWMGRSGRKYVATRGTRVRHGGMATVRKVVARGNPVGTSSVRSGVPLALKAWHEGAEASLDQLQTEAQVLMELSSQSGELPSPRLYDLVGSPLVTGIVIEWCPADLERWWQEKLAEADAFGRLMATMTDTCRRVSEYQIAFAKSGHRDVCHGDLKPSNILLSAEGRWLICDFGAARVRPPPTDSPWATSQVVVGTENFLPPELLFGAQIPFPAAMDTWALGATVFALLRMQRLALDGGPLPRNGTHSPRFRTQRHNQIIEIFGREPTLFRDKPIDPERFPDPLRLPEEDRRAVRESLRGCFGEPSDEREDDLADALLFVLDRALSIDPSHRYTDARDLSAAFENLTRTYIALAAQGPEPGPPPAKPNTEELVQDRENSERVVMDLQSQVRRLRELLAEANHQPRATPVPAQPIQIEAPSVEIRLPKWVVVLMISLLVMLFFTMLLVLVLVGLILQLAM